MLNFTWAFLDSPPPIPFAHRGVHLNVPENSSTSFSAAAELGYRYIETDVRSTRDGKVIICHDARARRIAGLSASISALTLAELRSAAAAIEGSDVPLLLDVLKGFPELRFNIDVKDKRAAELVPDIVREVGAQDRVCITSFSATRIRCVRSQFTGTVCTGAAVSEFFRFLVDSGHYMKVPQPAVLQLPLAVKGIPVVTRKLIDRAHQAGLPVHVWTLNDLSSIRAAIELEVDGIMTDEPVLLRKELMRRHLWH